MNADYKVEGLEDVLANIEGIADLSNLNAALGKCCAIVERSAKQKAPKEEGELRRSITSKVEDMQGIVYTPYFKAPYYEYGTGKYAENGNGRKELPWVYVEGSSNESPVKKVYTEQEADSAVAFLRSKGLDAKKSYGREATPFMRPALYENREQIIEILRGELIND